MKNYSLLFLFCLFICALPNASFAQKTIGTQGFLNIPSADMYPSKTFVGGVNYIGENIVHYDYPVYDYFIGFTPFSFLEATARWTLLKKKNNKPYHSYCEQDRSFTLRVRPVKENADSWLPGCVIGCNDLFSENGNSFYAALYGVLTKHINLKDVGVFGIDAGFFKPIDKGDSYDGFFAGINYVPSFCSILTFVCEYDSKGFNVGSHLSLFDCVDLTFFTREFSALGGGVTYRYTIKY